jgi:uncharacterized protein YndB with AHSA1/START domain
MKKIHMSVLINAPREHVFKTMLDDATYRQWTEPFNPKGGWFEGDWSEGSTMKFLGPDPSDDSNEVGGMYSRIAKNTPNEFLSIEHLGMIRKGEIDTESNEVKKWTPAFENYSFKDAEGGTEVTVDMDIADEYESMFTEMWTQALAKLKEICEQ